MGNTTTELIKEKLDIVDFIRGYLQVSAAGKNFKARCPFHSEKTPSFMISPDRQSWHCFGCSAHGDIFGFLMRYENIEFGEALRILAEKAGVELRRLNPAEYKLTGLLYELNEKAADFYKATLKNYEQAKKYLAGRGLKQETIDEFELGWAPQEPEALSMHILNSGYSPDDLLRAGLSLKTERGLLLDRFRGRIMFPIHNHSGKVVGFTGRILDSSRGEPVESTNNPSTSSGFAAAKYVNSPETAIFQKSRLLYGFHKAKNFIRETNSVFLVEGQMDVLMSHQAGVNNVVATSGTALTEDHLRTIRRLADTIFLSFDSDAAGSAAAERAIDMAEQNDFSVKVVAISGFKDPAEAVEKDSEILKAAIKEAVPAPMFYFNKYLPERGANWGSRENLRKLQVVLEKLKSITSTVERSSWVRELSKITGLEEKILLEEMERVKRAVVDDKNKKEEGSSYLGVLRGGRKDVIGELLLGACAATGNFNMFSDCAGQFSPNHARVFKILLAGGKKSEDPAIDEILGRIFLMAENLPDGEIKNLKKELALEHQKEERKKLSSSVKLAEEAGDEAALRLALEKLNGLETPVFES